MEENNGQANDNQSDGISKHEKRELKQQQKEEEMKKHEDLKRKKELKSKTIKYAIIGAIVLLAVFGMYKAINNIKSPNQSQAIEGVQCSIMEGQAMHIHPQLTILLDGSQVNIPSQIGIKQNCMYWIHTHSPDGILHVESPVRKDFFLGQFFQVWGKNPLEGKTITNITLNGKPYNENYNDILLNDKERIIIEAKS